MVLITILDALGEKKCKLTTVDLSLTSHCFYELKENSSYA